MKYVWKNRDTGLLYYRRVVKNDPPGVLAVLGIGSPEDKDKTSTRVWLRPFHTTLQKAALALWGAKHQEFEQALQTARLMLGNSASPNDPERKCHIEFVADARSRHGGRLPARHVEDPRELDIWAEYRAFCIRRDYPDPGTFMDEYRDEGTPGATYEMVTELLTTWEVMRVETELRMATVPDRPVPILVKPKEGRADSLTDLCKLYVEDRQRKLSPAYLSTLDMLIEDFVKTNGNIAIQQITDQHVISYREFVAGQSLAANTKNRYLRTLGGMLNWAIKQRYLTSNPFKHVSFDESDVEDREPFLIEDILKLFENSALQSPGGRFGYGVYALFVLTFLHGMRLREAAQLWTDDIVVPSGTGIRTIRIDTTHPGQSVKNKSSRRLIPIHRQALKLLEFPRPRQPRRLFEELPPGTRGDYTKVSQRVNEIIRRTGITNPRIVFHCTRHSMITQSRENGLDSEIRRTITGHTFVDIGEQYGRTSISAKKREIDKLDYGFAFPSWDRPSKKPAVRPRS